MNDARRRGVGALAWWTTSGSFRGGRLRAGWRGGWRRGRGLSQTWAVALAGICALLGLGCSDGQKRYAEDTVRLTSRALLDVENAEPVGSGTGGESPEVQAALRDAHDWLAPTEAALEMWAEGGDAAYERVAPCLGATLTALRMALMSGGLAVPTSLEQAEAQAHGASSEGCVRDATP
jgi:hypothetical protein